MFLKIQKTFKQVSKSKYVLDKIQMVVNSTHFDKK